MQKERQPSNKTNYMTRSTYDQLLVEVEGAKENMSESLRAIGDAAGGESDWHDNAAFDHANIKHDVDSIKHGSLSSKLRNIVIIEPSHDTSSVSLGNAVTVKYKGDDDEETYTILGPADSGRKRGWISYESPLGSSLMGKSAGEEVTFEVAGGKQIVKIIRIAPGDF